MKIRILQIGHKHDHAKQTFDSLMRLSDFFEVVGIADEDLEGAISKLPNAPAFYTIDQALKLDMDAVAIECEEEKATKYALMFAQKGIHVHLDKPGSQCTQEFHALIDLMQEKNLILQMGYMYRYNPAILNLIDQIKHGNLGTIFSVEAQMSIRHDKEKREWLGKFKGGMMYFLGCHLVDLVLQICGDPEEILALNAVTGTEHIDTEDYGFAVLKYKNGISFVKACASEYNGYARRQLVVTGSCGTVEIKPIEVACGQDEVYTPVSVTLQKDDPPAWEFCAEVSKTKGFNRYDSMMQSFAEYIHGFSKNPYTYAYEKKLFDTLMKCCGLVE